MSSGISSERRLTLACVIDLVAAEGLATRQKAYDDVIRAAKDYKMQVHQIQFDKLETAKEAAVLDLMYSADVAVVDVSLSSQQIGLTGHLGSRERFGMQGNFIIYHSEVVEGLLKTSLGATEMNSIGYSLSEDGRCVVTDSWMSDTGLSLYSKFKQLLKDVQVTTSTQAKETFLEELRKAREKQSNAPAQFKLELDKLRHQLESDPKLLSPETVFNLLISYRDIQDHTSMIGLMGNIQARGDQPNAQQCLQPDFMYWYCFALNRRNRSGDRAKALEVMEQMCTESFVVPDGLCLCGRIYKDMFVESDCSSKVFLMKAIEWYRKGFRVKPNEYAGINLATLLVVSGERYEKSAELQAVLMQLNLLLTRKGKIETLTDYWTVATLFEMAVLAENYVAAEMAAECMYKLKPQLWQIETTIKNIKLIETSRKTEIKENSSDSESIHVGSEQARYEFWTEFFQDISADRPDTAHYPVLIWSEEEDSLRKQFIPFYVTINVDPEAAGEKSIRFWEAACEDGADILLKPEHVKSVAPNKQDERCVFLYVVAQFSENMQVYFSCGSHRDRFYKLCREFLSNEKDFVDLDIEEPELMYGYTLDKNNTRILLGSGTYGRVYEAKDAVTGRKLAVKEIKVANETGVQLLQDEINLHSKLHHKNIVQYLGAVFDNGLFKIFMEQVPGGSLSNLLQTYGPLTNELTICHYSKQILEGLRYLHDQKIVHRDIKGGNVLVNTYSGVLKISDFGTCKRLAGLNSNANSFKGTYQYMAPEVIEGRRGYAAPADIWSFGCTVVEMATGKPPFYNTPAISALFIVGKNKTHAAVPEHLSPECQGFIECTFRTEPVERPSAAELLRHPFVNASFKRRHRTSVSNFDGNLSRSSSVPPDTSSSEADDVAAKRLRNVEIPDTADKGVGTSVSNTTAPTSPQPEQESSGSYWRSKKNEAQTALLRILDGQFSHLVGRMLESFENNNKEGNSVIDGTSSESILRLVIKCVQSEDGGRTGAKIIMDDLKTKVDPNDHNRLLKQLKLFLFLLKREVQDLVRGENVKPHWMFAFDDMISRAVQIILRQMGMSFDDLDSEPEKREYTSQTSTSTGNASVRYQEKDEQKNLKVLQDETTDMIEKLILAEQRYQALLQRSIDDRALQIRLLEAQLSQHHRGSAGPQQ